MKWIPSLYEVFVAACVTLIGYAAVTGAQFLVPVP